MNNVSASSNRCLLRADGEGKLRALSGSALRVFGSSAVGRPCHEVVGALHPDGTPICHQGCASALATGRSKEGETQKVRLPEQPLLSELHCLRVGDETVVVVDLPQETAGRERLTPREKEVLALVAQGLPSAQIAEKLNVRESTVRTHVEHARGRLGAHTRAEAVLKAIQTGQLSQA